MTTPPPSRASYQTSLASSGGSGPETLGSFVTASTLAPAWDQS